MNDDEDDSLYLNSEDQPLVAPTLNWAAIREEERREQRQREETFNSRSSRPSDIDDDSDGPLALPSIDWAAERRNHS